MRSVARRSRTPSPPCFAETVARVLADPAPWVRAGLEQAALLSWEETARRTVAVYREVLA